MKFFYELDPENGFYGYEPKEDSSVKNYYNPLPNELKFSDKPIYFNTLRNLERQFKQYLDQYNIPKCRGWKERSRQNLLEDYGENKFTTAKNL